MCGIWMICGNAGDKIADTDYYTRYKSSASRGPDNSTLLELSCGVKLGFHRLAIMGTEVNGNQPFINNYGSTTVYTMCNGEIYNYKKLIKKFNLEVTSESDCETIAHLYALGGIDMVVDNIRGEFSLIICSVNNDTGVLSLYAARDPHGVRPLYYTADAKGVHFASTIGGLDSSRVIQEFSGGSSLYATRPSGGSWTVVSQSKYYKVECVTPMQPTPIEDIYASVYSTLVDSVECRLMSNVPIGCLLSGGLDSSLISAIAARKLAQTGSRLHTFSIGMENSTDEYYARIVARHINSIHVHIDLDVSEWLSVLPTIVTEIGSFDITTVRASAGQYLVSKWIRENTDIRVLLVGDGSDECTSGYQYFHRCPSPLEGHLENIRLLQDISKYDVLRADRGIAGNGLEARVPFLDIRFTDLYTSIPHEYRLPHDGLEKWLLRNSFRSSRLLPDQILDRPKCAFSDGCSNIARSWSSIIKDMVSTRYTDDEFNSRADKFTHIRPHTHEALWYREIFEERYPNCSHLVPYYWMPLWCGAVSDPSARTLEFYKE